MKIFLGITIFLSILSLGVWAIGRPFVHGETMSQDDVCKKWGAEELALDKFRTANAPKRAAMACSILKNKMIYFGKDGLEIRKLFGDFDGYYFSNFYPTYLIQIGKNHSEDTWQLVFLIDRDRKISEIVVHKNCCE